MAKKTDILIVGGGPAGIITALSAKKYYPDKKIIVLKSIENGVIPCGIPYMVASLKNPDENKLGTIMLEQNGIEVVVDEAIKLDKKNKLVLTKNNEEYHYDKLVLAVGGKPIQPPIPGIDKKGVYPIYKDLNYLKETVANLKQAKNVLVIGGGFIGIEFADEISKLNNINVSIAEMLPAVLANSFDQEFSQLVEAKLQKKNIQLFLNSKVEKLIGTDKVEKAVLSNGKELEVDAVVLGIGAVPSIELAEATDLKLTTSKGIWVDEYMRTSDPDIYAVGDCAGKIDFYTRRSTSVMLASTATVEARVAGANLYEIKIIRENKGTIATYSTYVDGLVLGSAGLTQSSAQKEGFDIISNTVAGKDKHPGTLPDSNDVKVKLIFSKKTGVLLGGQVAGGASAGEMINVIGTAIQKRMTASELATLQIATHPYLTSAPTVYPIVLAAQNATV